MFKSARLPVAITALALLATPALARDALGMFGGWPSTKQRDYQPYADVAWWPRQAVRGQVHFRLSRKLKPGAPIVLSIGGQRLNLAGGGGDAWAADKRMDAAVIAAMRSAGEMTVNARGADGTGFSNTWQLDGAATAMDAAAVGCAQVR
jgi:hypothetical protein